MRVSFVSDIHGNVAGLAKAARDAERLVVLGDLLDYVDYHNPAAGILGEIFGADRVHPFIRHRSVGNFAGLHRLNIELWDSVADPVGTLTEVVARRYADMLEALSQANTTPLLILGNVDMVSIWEDVAGQVIPSVDGQVVEVGGHRFGFVGGGVFGTRAPAAGAVGGGTDPTAAGRPGPAVRAWRPYLRPADEYALAVADLGPVDVLCSHLPPRLPLLRYDRVPARLEAYGPGLLESIDAGQPQLAVFGHVHQPQAVRTRRGRTECVNVGHFARDPRPYRISL
ncbi:metallophosphoesterase family protein [Nakamurella lactea]|uniref:metallophosphoesterase family protein n=1 Tax=Nakamurella lactea TaxID=459515 RepID=UPI00041192D7|nr:metallophosphoesterase family protein [Nakamurella lactea]